MKKITILVAAAALALTGCSAAGEVADPSTPEAAASSEPATASEKIAPLLAAPAAPSPSLPPEFSDESAQGKYLAGVKKAVNAWRDGVIPSDGVLLEGAAHACSLFAQGMTYTEIGALAGENEAQRTNGVAVAVYASRYLCTAYNTDNL
ncbi:hypothetical protein AB4Y77_01905 [Paenarthrobacter sp. YAF11_1]|uniref:hypothetical protein n=1 Tax=Paenarthrobacter sp. YAF11_1 TaxID=3233074 RepID=UPI003F9A612F